MQVARIRNAIDADLMIFFITGRTDNNYFQARAKIHRDLGIAEHRDMSSSWGDGSAQPAPEFKRSVALDILKKIDGLTRSSRHSMTARISSTPTGPGNRCLYPEPGRLRCAVLRRRGR